jgi:DNA-binding CsgD family transcriptional regulator
LIRTIRDIVGETGWGDALAALAFFAGLPVLLPGLDVLHWLLAPAAPADTTFLWTMPLAAMFTALAILFVCLLKTGYHRLGAVLTRTGVALYLLGYAIVLLTAWFASAPGDLLLVAGLPLGVGLGILAMAWALRLRLASFRTVFLALVGALCVVTLINTGLLLLSPAPAVSIAFVLSCVGALAVLRRRAGTGVPQPPAGIDSNWWDVFGKMDVSLLEGTDDYKAPAARILFFIAAPLVMLLLFVVNRSMPVTLPSGLTPALLGCLIAVPCSLPLILARRDRVLINASFRLYLPLLAFCVFAADSFVLLETGNAIMYVGINVFCILYALLMAAMVITVANRMRSLVLPATGLLLIALSLVALLSYTQVDAGALITYQHSALILLFVAAVALLLATPGSGMWQMMLTGVAAPDGAGPSLQERCDALAGSYGLTAREAEILTYLGRGYGAAYVAELLVVAESTVRSHRKSIYRKLEIGSREELLELLDSSSDTAN